MDQSAFDLASLHSSASGEDQSWGASAVDAISKGLPAALVSGYVSMYNTGVALGNVLGAEADRKDTGEILSQWDDNTAEYYQNHQQGVDVGGFLITSLAPGLVGIKALKMLQGGTAGLNASRVTGALKTTPPSFLENPLAYTARMQTHYTEKALEKIRSGPNEIFSAVDRDKIIGIIAGAADQALQGAAFETAVLLTMNQSPILAKEDEGYFTSILRNSHDIVTAAEWQGAIGGVFTGLSIAGKLSQAVRTRDIEQFKSVHAKYVGANQLSADPGSLLATEVSNWKSIVDEFATRRAAGELDDPMIVNYERTIKNKEDSARVFLTKELLGEENAALNNQLWNLIKSSENPEETASLIFSAAKNIERISTANEPIEGGAAKVFFGGGQLPARQAENIIKRGHIFEDVVDNPTFEQLADMQALKKELYRDSAGVFHVLEDSAYAKQTLPKVVEPTKFSIILKAYGDNAGQYTTTAHPVVGDLGKVSLSKDGENLVIGSSDYAMPKTFDPIANSPIDANAQFTFAFLRDLATLASEEQGNLSIAAGNLPLLEAAARKGFEGNVLYGGRSITGDLVSELHQAKIEMRQELINAGHPFDRIARELNTTTEWAESGRGDGFILKDDHTLPAHALINYNTANLPDKFRIEGVASLMHLVKLGKDQNETVVASILGEDATRLASTKGTLMGVTTMPQLGGVVTSASADYGTFGMVAQQSGKVANSVVRKRAQGIFQTLQPLEFQAKADTAATMELNIVVNKFRAMPEPMYKFLDTSTGTTHFVQQSLYKDLQKAVKEMDSAKVADLLSDKRVFKIESQATQDYLLNHFEVDSRRAREWNQIFQANGSGRFFDPDALHVPPIDTRKYSHVAFMKEKMTLPGDYQEVGVVSAPTAAALDAKIDRLKAAYGDRFLINKSSDVKAYKEMEGAWETGPLLGDSLTDQAMRKEGLLYEFQPRTDAEIYNDFNNYHWRQENNIVRNTIELKYAQEFAELRAMAKRFNESKFGPKSQAASSAKNPYFQYIKTALDISNFDRYNSIWGKFNEGTEAIGSGMVAAWQNAFPRAVAGEVDWVAANAMAEKYGFTPPYKNAITSIVQPVIENHRAVEPAIAKINGAVSTLTLGWDFLNSVVNVLSFPIMGISEMHNLLRQVKGNPEILSALNEVTTVAIPESGLRLPTSMKLLSRAVGNYLKDAFTEGHPQLEYYKAIEAVKTPYALAMEVYRAASLTPDAISSLEKFSTFSNTLVRKTADFGKTVTLHNRAEEMVRFLAADMMKQITDITKIPVTDAPAYINSFVNRVHGNYMANQRPHLFQGVVGQAISLFQTYQFNVMQNMARYVGQGDKTAAAMLLGLQNTIFGLQGNPAFYYLNQAIGTTNTEHIDIVSGTNLLVGKELADWMIYGLGSNVLQTTLYNRGDLTPRYVTVVPSQISDVPAIAIPYKAINSFITSASQIVKGGNVQEALLNGVSHFSANRPIAGIAQLAQGFRTTAQGNLVTAYNDINGFTVAAKLAGGEELDRGIAIDAYYRNMAYAAYDREQRAALGAAVKTTMYRGQHPTEDQVVNFMDQYNRTGGTPQGFNRWMTSEFKHATQSQMNVLKSHVNSRSGRLQATMMGADTQDFWFNPPSPAVEE